MRFKAFRVDCDTLFFFENFREREVQNARERSDQDASVLVRLIVSMFHKKYTFSAIIWKFVVGSNCSKGKKLCVKGNNYAAPDCDSSDSDLVYQKRTLGALSPFLCLWDHTKIFLFLCLVHSVSDTLQTVKDNLCPIWSFINISFIRHFFSKTNTWGIISIPITICP